MANTKRTPHVAPTLIKNAQAAILAAIEIHNKPLMTYRYPLCVLLVINAWELALKAFIHKKLKKIKLLDETGHSLGFEKCLAHVVTELDRDFLAASENLKVLNEYRNTVAHFHSRPLDEVIFSLLSASILSFCDFLKDHFGKTLTAPENFVLLPLGFSNSYGPLHAIIESDGNQVTTPEIKEFLKSITRSIRYLEEQNIEDSILTEFNVHLVSVKKATNADLIAKIDNSDVSAQSLNIEKTIGEFRISSSPDAPQVRLPAQNERFKDFQITYDDLRKEAKERYGNFKQGPEFYALLKELKENPNCCQISYLDPIKKTGSTKPLFGGQIWAEMDKHYTLRSMWKEGDLQTDNSDLE